MSRRVLIVDEDQARRAAVCAALSGQYETVEATSNSSAQQKLQSFAMVECVLLSYTCEGCMDFLSAKRASLLWQPLPVLVLTDPADEAAAMRTLEMDATDVCIRPLRTELLQQRVRNLIRLRENTSLRRALERDPLTGIFNRSTFAKRTGKMLRKKSQELYQLQVWDVQHFKLVNDQLGSAVGDQVLRVIAHSLDEQLRSVGTYARLEGDHFALCYPARLYEPNELLQSASQRLEDLKLALRITLYAGVYGIDDISLSVDQMCDRAFMALQTVKGRYHERSAYYDSAMRDQLMKEQRIGDDMNDALQQGQFCFYLQPIYSITTGQPTSAEALVRWNHPTRGLIPPGDFIPLFERNGFITRMDVYLWESVCKYQHDLIAEGITPLPVSINVSRLNLYNPHLCDDIITMVRRYGLDPSLIKLEITETAYTDNPQQLLSATQTLREYGFEIMMDDFGSGYSSLNMLKDLPVDILKVDMRFLTDMEKNDRAANILASIIRMARWLNVVVVAEGVETQTQVDFLRSIGCDEVQGFFYARPMPSEEFRKLLQDPALMSRPYGIDRERLVSALDIKSLWDNSQQASVLFSGLLGAMCLCEKSEDALEMLRVNDSYFELTGCTPQSILQNDKNVLTLLEPGDRHVVLSTCERAVVTGNVEQSQISCPHHDGHLMWLDIKVRYLGSVNHQELFYIALSDITRQKEVERHFLLYQYGAAMMDAYSEVLELNYSDNLVTGFCFIGANRDYTTTTQPLDQWLRSQATLFIHPDDQKSFLRVCSRNYLEDCFRNRRRRSVSAEIRIRQGEQDYHWARLTLHPMQDPTGKFRTLCCNRDIDEQKQGEHIRAQYALLQAKQQEQDRYCVILEQTQTALLAWTPDDTHAEGNALATRYQLRNLSYMELLAGDVSEEIADPEDLSTLKVFLIGLKNHDSVSGPFRLKLSSGETRWCKLSVTVQRDSEKRILTLLFTINDVDQEHRMRLLLDAQRAQSDRRLTMLSHLYWTLPCCILQLDMNDPPRPIFFNRACWELFGFATKEAFDEATDHDLLALIVPEEREGFLELLRQIREQSGTATMDLTVLRPDGSRGSLNGNVALSHRSDGQPMLQLVLLDITPQREQENRLARTRASLERTTDMLQHLLENLPVGVVLIELGEEPHALYVNGRAYSMFGLHTHQVIRFSELLGLSAFHLDDTAPDGSLHVLDGRGNELNTARRVEREDGEHFWLRTYSTIVSQTNTPPLCYAVLADVSSQMESQRDFNRQSELYRIMMEDSHQAFFDYDLENDVMDYTIRLPSGKRDERRVHQYLKALKTSTVIHPEYSKRVANVLRRAVRTGRSGNYEFMADYYYGGNYRWFRAYYSALTDESGVLYRIVGRVVDIQEEKTREQQLGQAQVYRSAVNSVSLFVFAFSLPDMKPHLLSCTELRRSGFHPYLDYLDLNKAKQLVHPDECPALTRLLDPQELATRYRAGTREMTLPFRACNRKDQWIWLEINLHLTPGDGKNIIEAIGYVKVIEDRKALEHRASFDGLTQLLNRETVEEQIRLYLDSSTEPCSLMIFDVDNFKSVNDQLGHSAGDMLLRKVADEVRRHLRQSDIVGRLGGDEFVALLRNATAQTAMDKGAELLQAVANAKKSDPQEASITVSIGIACVPRDGQTFSELYTVADKALYAAKAHGKNCCFSSADMLIDATENA